MEIGDKIIWNSGFGYEIGFYLGVSTTQYNKVCINQVTGKYCTGLATYSPHEVKLFTDELNLLMEDLYGYKHSFAGEVNDLVFNPKLIK